MPFVVLPRGYLVLSLVANLLLSAWVMRTLVISMKFSTSMGLQQANRYLSGVCLSYDIS